MAVVEAIASIGAVASTLFIWISTKLEFDSEKDETKKTIGAITKFGFFFIGLLLICATIFSITSTMEVGVSGVTQTGIDLVNAIAVGILIWDFWFLISSIYVWFYTASKNATMSKMLEKLQKGGGMD